MIKTYGPYFRKDGRHTVVHYDTETKSRRTQVYSRYLWEQHNGPIPKGLHVDHIDSDPHNNDISNLQLLTQAENNKKYYNENKEKFVENGKKGAEASRLVKSKLD